MDQSNRIVVRGRSRIVEWAETLAGERPGQLFFRELPAQEQAKLLALLKRFADHGTIINKQQFKKLRAGLFEFKRGQVRFLGDYRPERRFLIASGLKKKQDKHRPKDLDRARKILKENDEREAKTRHERR